ncbi:MAG: hypothetical protein WBV80_18245 [Mycobacterium sp.]
MTPDLFDPKGFGQLNFDEFRVSSAAQRVGGPTPAHGLHPAARRPGTRRSTGAKDALWAYVS